MADVCDPNPFRHCEPPQAARQSSVVLDRTGLLRCARNDDGSLATNLLEQVPPVRIALLDQRELLLPRTALHLLFTQDGDLHCRVQFEPDKQFAAMAPGEAR
jgi:hypothetical protein